MLRATLALSLITGLCAYASDALACSPSPSRFVAPTGVMTDTTRPIARDAGFYFSGELRESYGPDYGFEIVVTDNATGALVEGAGNSFLPWLGSTYVLAWTPRQPLAANATYTIKVKPVPPRQPIVPPQMPLPPIKEMQAVFTTSADLLPVLELAAAPRLALRTETKRPFRCEGPCGPMTGPCTPKQILMADVEIPGISGGAHEHGYEVQVNVRYGKTSREDYYERRYPTLADPQAPKLVSVEAMEFPEAVEICTKLSVRDSAMHTIDSATVCVDAQTVAKALSGANAAAGTPAPAPQPQAAGSAPGAMSQAGAPAQHVAPDVPPAQDVTPSQHVSSCAVAAPSSRQTPEGLLGAGAAIVLLLLALRRQLLTSSAGKDR